jgi:hypothetical protein
MKATMLIFDCRQRRHCFQRHADCRSAAAEPLISDVIFRFHFRCSLIFSHAADFRHYYFLLSFSFIIISFSLIISFRFQLPSSPCAEAFAPFRCSHFSRQLQLAFASCHFDFGFHAIAIAD